MRQIIENTPIPLAGLALGVISLGSLLKVASPGMYWVAVCIATICIILLVSRVFLFTNAVLADFDNPVFASVSATFFMTFMQLSLAVATFAPHVGFAIWIAAVVGHLTLIIWFTAFCMRRFDMGDVAPTYFIAYVGIIVASVTSPTFGMQTIGQILFCFGFIMYVILFVIITYRLLTRPVADGAKPLICIYAAPMSLSLTGYLTVFVKPNLMMVGVAVLLAQIMLAFVLIQLPSLFHMLHNRFFPSIAAMTFPFVITATGLVKAASVFNSGGVPSLSAIVPFMQILAVVETALAICMVTYALIRYMGYYASVVTVSVPKIAEVEADSADGSIQYYT